MRKSRKKKVSLRKVVGAQKSQLVKQFMTESILFSFIAFPLSIIFVELVFPLFNEIVERDLNLYSGYSIEAILIFFVVVLIIGLISGSYPSFFITRYQPAVAVKGMIAGKSTPKLSRNIFAIVQFALSIGFILSTLIISQQMDYITNKKAGFNKDHIVVLPIKDHESQTTYSLLKSDLSQIPSVTNVTASRFLPSNIGFKHNVVWEGIDEDADIKMDWNGVDFDYLETFGINIAEGRTFLKDRETDKRLAYIVNEEAVREYSWNDPLGKTFNLSNEGLMRAEFEPGIIVGVVNNFHFKSYYNKIEPLVLKVSDHGHKYISIKVQPRDISVTLNQIKSTWDRINPNRPFDYFFFDEYFNTLYKAEVKIKNVLSYATILAIFLAALGLFGLASFKATQRIKEIGIRKVLGATSTGIVRMIARDFMILVLIAGVIAIPVGYLVMNKWLENFVYRIEIGLGVILLSIVFALIVAFLSVGYQAIKAANADPVETLHYE